MITKLANMNHAHNCLSFFFLNQYGFDGIKMLIGNKEECTHQRQVDMVWGEEVSKK